MDEQTSKQLQEAINERLENGVSAADIKQELRTAGYSESDIEILFSPRAISNEANATVNIPDPLPLAEVSEPQPAKRKRHWLRNTGIVVGILFIAWILIGIFVPRNFVFELFESDFRVATKEFYDRTSGDYSSYCESPEIAPLIEKMQRLAEHITCDSSPGGFDLVFEFDDTTYNCLPASASAANKNDYFACIKRPDFISAEYEEFQRAFQEAVHEHYSITPPSEILPAITEMSVLPSTHDFGNGLSLSKITLPHSKSREYELTSVQLIDGKLVLVGGFLSQLLLVDGHMPECLQALGAHQFTVVGEHEGEFLAMAYPQGATKYILHGCQKIGGQYRETRNPVSVYDGIAFAVESDSRSSRNFLAYKGNEYAQYSYTISHIQELGGEVAFVAEPIDKKVYALHKGAEVLVEIPKTDFRLEQFVTDGGDYYYVLRKQNENALTVYRNGEAIESLPKHLEMPRGYDSPYWKYRLRVQSTSKTVTYSDAEYSFRELTSGSVDAYILDGYLLVTASQFVDETSSVDIYFDPEAPWADALLRSVNFMYAYAAFDEKI